MGDDPSAGTSQAKPPVRFVLSRSNQLLGHRPDDPQAWDLKYGMGILAVKSLQTSILIAPFTQMMSAQLMPLVTAGVLAMTGGGAATTGGNVAVAGSAAALLFRFETGAGSGDWVFDQTSAVSLYASKLDTIGNFLDLGARARIRRAVKAAWRAPNPVVDDAAIAASSVAPTSTDKSPFLGGMLAGFIGGTQGFKLELRDFTPDAKTETYSYSIDAEFYDHFGVDDSDVNRSSLTISTALAPWFVLQHFRAWVPYRPFRTVTRVRLGPFTETV
jgi:hypothetical protein